MSLTHITAADAVRRLTEFDAIIDARSPAEYQLDQLPDAQNWPSLDDAERNAVGTLYKQVGTFEARRLGAALIARRIAGHIETHCMGKPKQWKPLIYCWRGGKRSNALAFILSEIGFQVSVLEGGYKAFRAQMLKDLTLLSSKLDYRVICAPTGSGKTRLLQALAQAGAQVLDLEALANHRSSVLGLMPNAVQPSQKNYDMKIWTTLRRFSSDCPVYVESESKKVGNVTTPTDVMHHIRAGACLQLSLPMSLRVQLLLEDYAHFVQDVDFFCHKLNLLKSLRGNALIEQWQAMARQGNFFEVVQELLSIHYDPSYGASMSRNFKHYGTATTYELNTSMDQATFEAIAQKILAQG